MPFLTMAHAGHGHVQHGISHYLTSPIHLFGVVAIHHEKKSWLF